MCGPPSPSVTREPASCAPTSCRTRCARWSRSSRCRSGQSIVWASSLSFLGLGVAPPSSEWGALLDAGRAYIVQAGWLVVIPGLVIVALALTATTIGRHVQSGLERGEKS